MELFDTHAHLSDEAFDEDRHSLIPKLFESGVTRIIDVACDVRTADRTIELIDRYPFIYGTVGMHPHDVSAMDNAMMDRISDILQHKKMLALGEIGLDYHYDLSPRDCQRKWFAEQLELAKQLGYPVVLHIREAFGDCMDILHAHRDGLRGVMHCYSGSVETAYECLDLGLKFSFGGAVTFKNAKKPVEVVQKLPLDSIMLETDCPYMTPCRTAANATTPGLCTLRQKKLRKFAAFPQRKSAPQLIKLPKAFSESDNECKNARSTFVFTANAAGLSMLYFTINSHFSVFKPLKLGGHSSFAFEFCFAISMISGYLRVI